MYRLQLSEQNKWAILDESDQDVFRGTLPECESWLDAAENQHPVPQACSEFRLRDWILLGIAQRTSTEWRWPLGSHAATGRFDK